MHSDLFRRATVILISLSLLSPVCFAQGLSDADAQAQRSKSAGASYLDSSVAGPRLQSPTSPNADADSATATQTENEKSVRIPVVTRPDPPAAPTEFQDFVTGSIGQKLPIYGHSLFNNVPTTFAPIDRVPVTADYVIGPGDELLVRAWGQIDFSARLTVDRNGEVFIPKVGAVSVAGIRYQQLHDRVKTAIARVFRNFDLTVSLGQLRSIQVFVVGQARHPGTYTVSSLSTLVNALFASGGPSSAGSMRHIQLKRGDTVVTEFDFYDLLLHGDKSKDVRLLPGDVIYIPPVGHSIAVAGSVNVPAIYELGDKNTLRDAIELAGGLATTADGQKVVLERIENRTTRTVEEFPLDEKGFQVRVKDGDLVRVFSLSPKFENAVSLRGNVAQPGRYAWHSGMRIRDLIPQQSALVTRDYWRQSNAISTVSQVREYLQERTVRDYVTDGQRQRTQNRPFAQTAGEDQGVLAGRGSLEDAAESAEGNTEQLSPNSSESGHLTSLPVAGRTRRSQPSHVATENTTAGFRSEMKRIAPDINWDYAVIQRLNPQDLTIRLVPFNLGKAILEGDEANNLLLEPGDIVTVFSEADLAIPVAKQTKFVRLEGEFKSAGVYRVEPGESLRKLVQRAGGLSQNAYLYGAEFTRESSREHQQKGLNQLIENLDKEIARSASSSSGLTPDEIVENRMKLDAQRQLVDKLRQVKASGRVVLELKPDASSADALPDIPLEDGDRFVVPYRPATVDVVGSVYNKNSYLYRSGKRVSDYLKQAGGTTRGADNSRIFIVRADGSVLSKQSVNSPWKSGFNSLQLMPGDALVVPDQVNKITALKAIRDWSQVFSQFALGAAAINVLK